MFTRVSNERASLLNHAYVTTPQRLHGGRSILMNQIKAASFFIFYELANFSASMY